MTARAVPREPRPAESVVLATMEPDMRDAPARLREEVAALGEDDLGKRDLWLFGPLIVVVAALPIAMVAVVSASLYFATHSADRYGGASFASRFENVYTR